MSAAMKRVTGRTLRRRGRAATMMEFVLILPFMLFVSLFTVDMGNVVLVNGAMQDVAYSSARAGAQVGGGSLVVHSGTYPCGLQASGAGCRTGVSYDAFAASVAHVPGYASSQVRSAQMQILSGGKCVARASGGRADNHVSVKVTYSQKLLTPGLAILMKWSGSDIDGSDWNMSVVASSRCEIVR